MDFRYGIHTIELFHRVSKKGFNKVFHRLNSLDKEMTKLLHEIGLNCEFEQLTLSRIDCCLDYFPDSQDWVDEALRVVRRSPYMKKYELCTFNKTFSNHKKKNAHSWRICCKTTTLTVYDKTFQLMEEDLLEDYDAPMLRFEVSRSGAKFKRGLSERVKGSNKKILKTVMDESEDTIRSYMEMLHADLPFVRYSDCMTRIETVKHASTRKNMRLLVKKLSDCKSYAQAVYNSKLTENQLRTVRKQFEKLGIRPITLKDKAEVEELNFVL